ncbi:MAG: hypothetical protein ACI9XC_000618 [Gammaproteobacteria bacterium]|jgi:hypothetical protein
MKTSQLHRIIIVNQKSDWYSENDERLRLILGFYRNNFRKS